MQNLLQSNFGQQKNLNEKPFLAGNVIKSIVFCLLALSLVVLNFFFESKMVDSKEPAVKAFEQFDYSVNNVISDNGLIRFAKSNPGSDLKLQVLFNKPPQYIFKLDSGKLWADFSISNTEVNILVDKVVLIPRQAVFDLSFNGSKMELNVFEGNVVLGFLSENVQLAEYQTAYSKLFMNSMLVPRDTQIIIPLKKITEKLAPLLASKLIKEFKYAVLPESVKNSDWFKQNIDKDKKFIESVKQNFIAGIISRGQTVKKGLLNDFTFWAEEKFTLVPGKKRTKIFEQLFAYLNDAIFYASDGNKPKSVKSLDNFNAYLSTLPSEISHSGEFYLTLSAYVDNLAVFRPDDSQYMIFKFLIDKEIAAGKDIDKIMQLLWADLDASMKVSDVLTAEALDLYKEYFEKTMENYKTEEAFRVYLTYQNQLFDNLLLKYAQFYKDAYFIMKNGLEQNLLATYEESQLKEELKQALVSNKLNFLKKLRQCFFEGKLELKETKEIFERLVTEIDQLMPENDSEVAVIKLFEDKLADIDDFYAYLMAPEYHALSYGATHEDRYKVYLKERETIWNFIDLQKDILGEEVTEEVTVVDLIDKMEEFFGAYEDVSELQIGKFDDVEQRYVEVKLVLGGYPLEAVFDRDTEALKDVKVYGELVTDRPVKIDSLIPILQKTYADLADDLKEKVDGGEKITLETSAQRFARAYIAKKVQEFGFKAGVDEVSVVDELNAVYRIENVSFQEYKNLKVTFDFLMSEEIAANVFVIVKGMPKVMEGKYTLEELSGVVIGEYDFAVNPVEKEPEESESLVDGESENGGKILR